MAQVTNKQVKLLTLNDSVVTDVNPTVVAITKAIIDGIKIADINVNGDITSLYAPNHQDISGKLDKDEYVKSIANYALASTVYTKDEVYNTSETSSASEIAYAIKTINVGLERAENYAKGIVTGNKYLTAAASYPGQHITVVDETNLSAQMYLILNTNGDLRKILAEPLKGMEFNFDNYSLKDILKLVIETLGGTVIQLDPTNITTIKYNDGSVKQTSVEGTITKEDI